MSEDELAALLRQVERAGLFTHSALGRGHLRQRELESFVYGLIDVLTARGLIEEGELSAAVEAVREQMDSGGEVPEPGVVLRVDAPEAADMPPAEVDCGARHIWAVGSHDSEAFAIIGIHRQAIVDDYLHDSFVDGLTPCVAALNLSDRNTVNLDGPLSLNGCIPSHVGPGKNRNRAG